MTGDAVPVHPAGGSFAVWKKANVNMIHEEAQKMPGGIGRGGVARKASEIWKAMSEADKAPWQAKFQEQLLAYKKYKASDAYVKPEKKFTNREHATMEKDADAEKKKLMKKMEKHAKKLEPADVVEGEEEDEGNGQEKNDAAVLTEASPSKKQKHMASSEENLTDGDVAVVGDDRDEEEEDVEALGVASPAKKMKVMASSQENTPEKDVAVLAAAKREGLHLKLKAMMGNPKIASKGSQVLLDALRNSHGKVPEAKRALLK
eukprot:gnl/MRDRNA2_/MRDRNA2_56150_c0_seq1.p1 gnl/MRDRNA2_/MRDRNA2_56150_c0~~gnl/MRDRNA2_/MRDRNA2_56150_c0_seq1.p1  ORF type:complete len:280 (-),score=102.64 gnl/MRDRNA2_/MRDRNA2_56150_c0_seq1:64-846(-)